MALTEIKLRSLRSRDKLYRVTDGRGLTIEVNPNGSKLWRYRYRYAGKESMLSLGAYPEVSSEVARGLRVAARALLVKGINPAAQVRAQRSATVERAGNSFAAIAAEWFSENEHRLAAGTLVRDKRIVEKDMAPFLGNTPIAELTAKQLLDVLKRMQARGALETAHRARSMASKFFRYAIATGRAERNPAADLIGALPTPNKESFAAITDPKQVGELLRAIHGYTGQPATATALKLALLFGIPSIIWSVLKDRAV